MCCFKLYFGLVNPRVTAFFFLPSDFILFYLDVGLLYVYVFLENLEIRIKISVSVNLGIDIRFNIAKYSTFPSSRLSIWTAHRNHKILPYLYHLMIILPL